MRFGSRASRNRIVYNLRQDRDLCQPIECVIGITQALLEGIACIPDIFGELVAFGVVSVIDAVVLCVADLGEIAHGVVSITYGVAFRQGDMIDFVCSATS